MVGGIVHSAIERKLISEDRAETLIKKDVSKNNDAPAPNDFQLDYQSRALYIGRREVKLTPNEFSLVELFLSHIGDLVSYVAIDETTTELNGQTMDDLPVRYPNRHIHARVRRLREKITAIDPAFIRIENVSGRGYRWRT